MVIWIIIAVLLVTADRITKYLVSTGMELYESIPAVPGFDICYTRNTGAAFSMFSDMTVVLSVISVVFCAAIIWYVVKKRPKNKLFMLSLTLLFAGALGNAIDRVFLGYVVDFIKTTFIDFAIFNVADIEITIGAALLMIYVIFFDRETEKTE